MYLHYLFLKAVQIKTSLTLKMHIETVSALQGIFPETQSRREPGACGGHGEAPCGTVAQMSLCAALWLLHHFQTLAPGPTAGGFGGRSPR